MFDVTYAGNKGNHFNTAGYDLNQVDPALRAQLGQSLFDRVPNPNAGLVPGGLGGTTITRERSLMAFPHYSAVNIRNPRMGNYISRQVQINAGKRMAEGLLVHFAFTGGKRMSDDMNVPVDFGLVEQTNEIGFQNGLFDRQANKSVDPTDVYKRGVISVLYELPFGRGKRWDPQSAALRKMGGGLADQLHRCDANRPSTYHPGSVQLPGEPPQLDRPERQAFQPDRRAMVQH